MILVSLIAVMSIFLNVVQEMVKVIKIIKKDKSIRKSKNLRVNVVKNVSTESVESRHIKKSKISSTVKTSGSYIESK